MHFPHGKSGTNLVSTLGIILLSQCLWFDPFQHGYWCNAGHLVGLQKVNFKPWQQEMFHLYRTPHCRLYSSDILYCFFPSIQPSFHVLFEGKPSLLQFLTEFTLTNLGQIYSP